METPLPAASAAMTERDDLTRGRVDDALWALLQEDAAASGLDGTWPAIDGCIVTAPCGNTGALARRRRR